MSFVKDADFEFEDNEEPKLQEYFEFGKIKRSDIEREKNKDKLSFEQTKEKIDNVISSIKIKTTNKLKKVKNLVKKSKKNNKNNKYVSEVEEIEENIDLDEDQNIINKLDNINKKKGLLESLEKMDYYLKKAKYEDKNDEDYEKLVSQLKNINNMAKLMSTVDFNIAVSNHASNYKIKKDEGDDENSISNFD